MICTLTAKNVILLTALTLSCGCATNVVVRDPVSQDKTFTVIPEYSSYSEISFATDVEAWLLGAGVDVIQRPAIMRSIVTSDANVTGRKSSSDGNDSASLSKGAGTRTTDEFYGYKKEDIKSAYVMLSYDVTGQLKIIRAKDDRVLAIFTVNYNKYKGAVSANKEDVIKFFVDCIGVKPSL